MKVNEIVHRKIQMSWKRTAALKDAAVSFQPLFTTKAGVRE